MKFDCPLKISSVGNRLAESRLVTAVVCRLSNEKIPVQNVLDILQTLIDTRNELRHRQTIHDSFIHAEQAADL